MVKDNFDSGNMGNDSMPSGNKQLLSVPTCINVDWIMSGLLSIESLGTKFCEILIKIQIFSIREMQLKIFWEMSAILSRGRWGKVAVSNFSLYGM